MSLLSLLRHLTWTGAVAGLLFIVVPSTAQTVDESTRAAARQVGYEGLEAYKAGQYEVALEKLNRAYAVVPAPSLGLWTARSMEKLGRLVQASERYLEVTRLEVSGGDLKLQQEAQAVAAEEREALQPRIPKVKVVVEGAPAEQVQVELDGQVLPTSLVGVSLPVNPGLRCAQGRLGERVIASEGEAAEGQSISLVLRFPAAAPPAAAAPEPALPPAPAEPAPVSTLPPAPPEPYLAPDSGASPGTTQRTAGWVGIGVGAAGIVVGGITGAMALSRQQQLESSDQCLNEACGPDEHDNIDTYNALRTISTAGFIVAGVGLAAGISLLLTAPSEDSPGAQVSAWIGAGSVGVGGRF